MDATELVGAAGTKVSRLARHGTERIRFLVLFPRRIFHWLFTKGPFSMDIPVLLWLLLYGFLKPWEDMETVRQHIKSLLNLVVRPSQSLSGEP